MGAQFDLFGTGTTGFGGADGSTSAAAAAYGMAQQTYESGAANGMLSVNTLGNCIGAMEAPGADMANSLYFHTGLSDRAAMAAVASTDAGFGGSPAAVLCSDSSSSAVTRPKVCQKRRCTKEAALGYEQDGVALCTEHPIERATKDRRCWQRTCPRQASYGYAGKRPVACLQHREDGMMNLMSKRCTHHLCQRVPSFGFEGCRAAFAPLTKR